VSRLRIESPSRVLKVCNHAARIGAHACALGAVLAFASPPAGAQEPVIRIEKLSNSLEIVVVERPALPLVSAQLWFRAGTRLNSPACPQAAEYVAAILTAAVAEDDLVAAYGLPVTSYAWPDAVGVAVRAPAGLSDDVLRALARAAPPERAIDQHFDAVRAVRVERAALDDAVDVALRAALFAGHEYGTPQAKAEAAPTQPQLREHCDRWLAPGAATLIVAGDVLAPAVVERARTLFNSWEWRQPHRLASPDPPEGQVLTVSVRTPQPRAAFVAPAAGFFEATALDVLCALLTEDESAGTVDGERLFLTWQRQSWRDAGMLLATLGEREGVPLDARIQRRLQTIASHPPAPLALLAARARVQAYTLAGLSDFDDWAVRLAEAEIVAGNVLDWSLAAARPEHVRVDDVSAAARRLLEARRAVAPLGAVSAEKGPAPETGATTLRPIAASDEPAPRAGRDLLREPRALPPIRRGSPAPGVRLSLCPLPGPALAVVAVRTVGAAAPLPERLRTEAIGPDEFAALCAFRGIQVASDHTDNAAQTLWAACAPREVDVAVELLRDVLRPGAPAAEVHVVAAGPLDAPSLERWIADCFTDFPIRGPHERPPPDATAGTRTIDAVPSDAERAHVRLLLSAPASGLTGERALVARALACVIRDECGLPRRSSWHEPPRGPPVLGSRLAPHHAAEPLVDFSAVLSAADAGAVRDRLEALRAAVEKGALPAGRWSRALDRARAERLLALDGPAAIVSALLAGEEAPWTLPEQLDASVAARTAADLLGALRLSLTLESAAR